MYESLTFTSLGELIKEKRIALELSISEVSRRTGISKGIISKIESGETKRPELRNIRLLADVLHISYDSIIELYIELDNRIDILDSFLSECVNINVPNFL
ncbi:helix-turn-helix domain-containing protein [Brevibacillus laterosporus]|uniref:helix-turn-helix domain-containing protein n=1 Tax=Brevibacillus laterosporus TaxID=1465 RepID=UPI000A4807CB